MAERWMAGMRDEEGEQTAQARLCLNSLTLCLFLFPFPFPLSLSPPTLKKFTYPSHPIHTLFSSSTTTSLPLFTSYYQLANISQIIRRQSLRIQPVIAHYSTHSNSQGLSEVQVHSLFVYLIYLHQKIKFIFYFLPLFTTATTTTTTTTRRGWFVS